MSKIFLDTNIIVYANDARDVEKQKRSLEIVAEHMRSGTGVISTQVLQEYAHVALNKLHQRQDVVLRQLVLLEGLEVIQQSPALIRRSVEIKTSYQISFWDACIISAAEHAKCDVILSEDLNNGQFYSGIAMKNPFT
ncbi:MAG: PIN domain-containing protein [gamma proteobacterium endosymbiont of Lamellibrachia anaximandri]|nr:PIN domain-containing protein [gamma proteobacterium endosymbiont of Lamellibrachia anaximandri]MBL3618484.1 PIN domain-containing protein [gamma proteobacterium endosymbiont of Lamellibrachia anaximandri]